MLTKPTALAIWKRLAWASPGWYDTPEARQLLAKSYRLVRIKDGKKEARTLRDLIETCKAHVDEV